MKAAESLSLPDTHAWARTGWWFMSKYFSSYGLPLDIFHRLKLVLNIVAYFYPHVCEGHTPDFLIPSLEGESWDICFWKPVTVPQRSTKTIWRGHVRALWPMAPAEIPDDSQLPPADARASAPSDDSSPSAESPPSLTLPSWGPRTVQRGQAAADLPVLNSSLHSPVRVKWLLLYTTAFKVIGET